MTEWLRCWTVVANGLCPHGFESHPRRFFFSVFIYIFILTIQFIIIIIIYITTAFRYTGTRHIGAGTGNQGRARLQHRGDAALRVAGCGVRECGRAGGDGRGGKG